VILSQLRQALLGRDLDVTSPRVLSRVTVGVLAAWIAMGGDLLGSCVYGADVLGRAGGEGRFVLFLSTVATLATLALLAFAYIRMIAQFPSGGGGYTAAKETIDERAAIVSGVALVVDAALNIAVSVVTCVRAAADAIGAERVPVPAISVALIVGLTLVNLRGVKESVTVLAPIVLLFVVSHLVVLGVGIVHRGDALPGVVAAVPSELRHSVAEHGAGGTLWKVLLAYALGGAIYPGLESVSNGVPVLREPKVRNARRTMILVAGVPAAVLAAIFVNYLLCDVRPEGTKTMNAVLFDRLAGDLGVSGSAARVALTTVPLLAEAVLLLMAAQTGFVFGPRILGVLATDRLVPRRLARFNGRLAPAPAILLISTIAILVTLASRAALEPLVIAFVISVFVTFSISQWAMLRHALGRRRAGAPAWRLDALVHATALVVCALILVATTLSRWRPSLVSYLLIGAATLFSLRIRRRYRAMAEAVGQLNETVVPAPPRETPVGIVVLFSQRSELPRVALKWLLAMPIELSEVVVAGVSLLNAEAAEGQEQLTAVEAERRRQLEALTAEAKAVGVRVTVTLRRGANVVETAAELVHELVARSRRPHLVIGFRAAAETAAIDAILREDDAVALQTRLSRDNIAMLVCSIPLDA
jgi:amino acid transporter